MRVLIVGGGVIGSAIAYFLKIHGGINTHVTVLERDPSYQYASSALSASSIRQQFSSAINIQISQFGIQFLKQAPHLLALGDDLAEIDLVESGYLFLADTPAKAEILLSNHRTQTALGADIHLLSKTELQKRFPWLTVSDIELGSWGAQGEGWFDGYSLLRAFKRKAQSLGAHYIHDEAVGVTCVNERITHVQTQAGMNYPVDVVVNAAGPWAAQMMNFIGLDMPVRARRRCVFVLDSPVKLLDCPLVIDPSGAYFRPEGQYYISGMPPSPELDIDGLPLEVDHCLFDETMWPILAHRVPAFEALRVKQAWAGYYEMNTVDHNALVGFHSDVHNLMLANGFSGHGLQQSPAVGRGVAELILQGAYQTLDLSPLSPDRLQKNQPLLEKNVV